MTTTKVAVASMKAAIILLIFAAFNVVYVAQRAQAQSDKGGGGALATAIDKRIEGNAEQMLEQGRQIFRYDTFGDEAYWTDKLKLHRAIEGSVALSAIPPSTIPSRPASAIAWMVGPIAI
jgi:hypothetical protein